MGALRDFTNEKTGDDWILLEMNRTEDKKNDVDVASRFYQATRGRGWKLIRDGPIITCRRSAEHVIRRASSKPLSDMQS